jgi:pimeloyl-ACP methyl ester carboxylesterase
VSRQPPPREPNPGAALFVLAFLFSPAVLVAWAAGQAWLRRTGWRGWRLALPALAAGGLVVLVEGGPLAALAVHFSGYLMLLQQFGQPTIHLPAPSSFLWPQLPLAVPTGLLAAGMNTRRTAVVPAEFERAEQRRRARAEQRTRRRAHRSAAREATRPDSDALGAWQGGDLAAWRHGPAPRRRPPTRGRCAGCCAAGAAACRWDAAGVPTAGRQARPGLSGPGCPGAPAAGWTPCAHPATRPPASPYPVRSLAYIAAPTTSVLRNGLVRVNGSRGDALAGAHRPTPSLPCRATTLSGSYRCIATRPGSVGAAAADRSAMTASQPPQLVRLPDGRRLAFAEYGPDDGVPCIVLSGMPGSRLAPRWAFPAGLLADRGVRLLGVDRPGYGRSDPNPTTTALGVAEDLRVLCAAVGLNRVAVLGISVGAPFALACAFRLPQRVGALLLSSPMGPWELPETRAGISRRNRRYFTLARRAPALSRAACWLWARTALLAVASRPWGFLLREVTVPTYLWHGAADQDVPIAAARRMAQTIPTCQATFTDEGHLMGLRHASEAVEAIRAATSA